MNTDRAQTQTSSAENTYAEPAALRDEKVGIIPQLGAMTFTNQLGEYDSRQLVGIGVDLNFAAMADYNKDYYAGLSTGAFYSHVGAAGANFMGAGAGPVANSANLLVIPANIKLGYHYTGNFRASVRGGANIIYRSVVFSQVLGATGDPWTLYPNVGADFEFAVGDNVAIIVRPDLTIAPIKNMFMGTAGAVISL